MASASALLYGQRSTRLEQGDGHTVVIGCIVQWPLGDDDAPYPLLEMTREVTDTELANAEGQVQEMAALRYKERCSNVNFGGGGTSHSSHRHYGVLYADIVYPPDDSDEDSSSDSSDSKTCHKISYWRYRASWWPYPR